MLRCILIGEPAPAATLAVLAGAPRRAKDATLDTAAAEFTCVNASRSSGTAAGVGMDGGVRILSPRPT
jgi:hypothetical protein